MSVKIIKLFLRFSIALSFLSAVADRFGMWPAGQCVWCNWENFLAYTRLLNPWLPQTLIPVAGTIATGAELILALFLLIGFKTELTAKLSGILLLLFACAMTVSTGIKGPLDYSVFTVAAAAFAISQLKDKTWELDSFLTTTTSRT